MTLDVEIFVAVLVLGFFGLMAFVAVVVARHEQVKLVHARELAEVEHRERMAMIERGMAPRPEAVPPAGTTREQTLQYCLSTVTGGVAFCAWQSGSPIAWIVAGVVGLLSVGGILYVYFRSTLPPTVRVEPAER